MSQIEGEKLSYMSLTPHLKLLRYCGIFPVDSSSPKLKKKLHGFYMCISFSLLMLYALLQIIHVYQVNDIFILLDLMFAVRTDIDKVMDSMFLHLTFLDCICKQIVFYKYPQKILEMLDIMKSPSFNQGVDEHRPLLEGTIKYAQFLLNLFNRICIIIGFLWMIIPLILHWKQETVEFTIWLPFDANENPKFYMVICYIWIQITWTGLNNSTMDIFIVYLFAQIKTQISILRINLESLVGKCREEKSTSYSFTETLEHRFKEIFRHYNEIIRFSKINEDIFSGPILFQFLVSGWIICTSAYRTISMSPVSGEFFSMILYMICIFSEIFLFCFYGNEVAHESQMIMESAYSMQWEEMPLKYRRYLVIFMERIKCPILPKAGKIVPLSMNTFIQIVKLSYTFYTLLKNSM